MLAFIFWHWPYPEVDSEAYESRLADFHRSLAEAKPEGFQRSVAFRIDGAPWISAADRGYEDWYLLDGSAAVDPLNEAAVGAVCKESHDSVVEFAAAGAGGLYELREGEAKVASCRSALWLRKPRETAYQEFYARLRSYTDRPGVSLWRRHLVLGPTPEFCLLTPGALEPLEAEVVSSIKLNPVWP